MYMSRFDVASVLNMPALPGYLARVEMVMAEATRTDNLLLHEPLQRLLRTRGKRLRPSLVLAVAASRGKSPTETAITCAAAVELVHLATLVHDDIMDKSATRWHAPTIQYQEGVGTALLVGDYLLAKACALAGTASPAAATLIAETIATLCEGQARETADQHNLQRNKTTYFATIRDKTASLTRTACQLGALCAELPEVQKHAYAQYGENFGMAFQIIDDVLDLLADTERSGKPAGNDIREGTYTLPVLLALQSSQAPQLHPLLAREEIPVAELVELLVQSRCLAQTFTTITRYNKQAQEALASLDIANNLRQLPSEYFRWAMGLATPNYRVLVSDLA